MKLKKIVGLTAVLLGLMFISLEAQAYKAGNKGSCLWKGKWYKCTVKSVSGDSLCIHYDGWSSSWDECLNKSRFRGVSGSSAASSSSYSVGQSVMVKWKSKWWKAKVLKAGTDTWYITYDGYGSKWDEWVGRSRIRAK